MSSLKNWLESSEENRRVFAQEGLILEVSEAIWEALTIRRWTKADLAKALGTSKANVTQLLNGGRNMTLRTLADIAFALGFEVRVQLCDADGAEWSQLNEVVVVGRRPFSGLEPVAAANDSWSAPQRAA